MSAEWYYSHDGEQVGPVNLDQLLELWRSGGLVPTDLVWHTSATSWIPADQCPELGSVALPEPAAAAVPVAAPAPILGYQGPSSETGIVATARALEMLRQTKPWVLFMSIFLYIAGGLNVVIGLIAAVGAAVSPRTHDSFTTAIFCLYVLVGVLYIVPAVFLTRYGSLIGRLMITRNSHTLESALEAQKSFWRYVGILTVVVFGVCVALVLGAMVIATVRMR